MACPVRDREKKVCYDPPFRPTVLMTKYINHINKLSFLVALNDFRPNHYVALLLCLIASLHQWRCHRIFQQIGKPKAKAENHMQESKAGTAGRGGATGTSKYVIPYGDWFFYVSSPHYFAEILFYVAISSRKKSCHSLCDLNRVTKRPHLLPGTIKFMTHRQFPLLFNNVGF